MPHHPDDQRHPHLRLVREEVNPLRRKQRMVPPRPPHRGGRAKFGRSLGAAIDQIESDQQKRSTPPAGIQPHLVFRIPLAAKANPAMLVDQLEKLGISVVSIESDGAIIAFHDEPKLDEFRRAVGRYLKGPSIDPKTGRPRKSTQWDVFEWIEADRMKLWGRKDRIGPRLADVVGTDAEGLTPSQDYVLDVDLWHPGNAAQARSALGELKTLVASSRAGRVTDEFVGTSLCLARVRFSGVGLRALLELDAVAEVDLPPTPVFDAMSAQRVTKRDFPVPARPPGDGPRVCVLDSGIASGHPLIANNVGHAAAILTSGESAADGHGHGTMVGGVAVFGDVRASYESGRFASEVTLFSGRVLNKDNQFDDTKLILNQMREAVRFFTKEPYVCRVFNISLGDDRAIFVDGNRRQGRWAETLDVLAREERVLFVVSAGNHQQGNANNARDAEQVLREHPTFVLGDPKCGLCDPATAALAITVGAIAEHDKPAVRHGRDKDDLVRVIARIGEPTLGSRLGPGVNKSIKPEFVASGGNHAFSGFGSTVRSIKDDEGLAVMSLSHEPTKQLFAFNVGTSFAAPRVARLAALVWKNLESQLGSDHGEIHPNLVRAVLASGAAPPTALVEKLEAAGEENSLCRFCGYGAIDEDLVLESADRRVTLVAQNSMPFDSFHLYEVPIPEEFRQASGRKRIVVSLAFDPPVRRRRSEYLGVRMESMLIRGKTIDEIVAAYEALAASEDNDADVPKALKSPFKCPLAPGTRALQTSTLQRSEWSFKSSDECYGDSYYLLIRCHRRWASSDIEEQTYAVSVTMTAEAPELYDRVEQRVQARLRARVRPRPTL